jgi:hypothetical protein
VHSVRPLSRFSEAQAVDTRIRRGQSRCGIARNPASASEDLLEGEELDLVRHDAPDALGGLRVVLVVANPEPFLQLVVIDTSGAVLTREELPRGRGGTGKSACR